MKNIKVLFQNRPTINSLPGGDVVQMNKTKEYLEKLGLKINISTELSPDVSPYDLVHVFNIETPLSTLAQVRNAKRDNKPVVLSTIFSYIPDQYRYYSFYHYGKYHFIKKNLPNIVNRKIHRYLYNKELRIEKMILKFVDLILPNSEIEMQQMKEVFGSNLPTHTTITNAVDFTTFENASSKKIEEQYGVRDLVLEVGRINFVKNQLNLIKAMEYLDIPLVLIGQQTEKRYYELCQREAKKCKNVIFIPHTEQNELKDFYAAAKVHVLPSFRETTGLVSLEAALCGCNLVASTFGCHRAYLHDFAEYCEPDDPESIRKSILKAYRKPKNSQFSNYIKENYTWEKAAQQTLDAYQKLFMH